MYPDYFPPTPAASDRTVDTACLPMTPRTPDPPVAPDPDPATTASPSAPPSRVTLHLGHLPDRKDIKAPWPRTPSRVCATRFLVRLL